MRPCLLVYRRRDAGEIQNIESRYRELIGVVEKLDLDNRWR